MDKPLPAVRPWTGLACRYSLFLLPNFSVYSGLGGVLDPNE
jgi:hypothetical protein